LAVDWFRQRGHTKITVFVPQWRKESSRPDARITGKFYELLTLPEHLSSPPVFNGVRVTQS
jgi:hypothetical protein